MEVQVYFLRYVNSFATTQLHLQLMGMILLCTCFSCWLRKYTRRKCVPVYARKAYKGVRGTAPLSLNLCTRGDQFCALAALNATK